MKDEEKEASGIKVVDRRRFTESGESRNSDLTGADSSASVERRVEAKPSSKVSQSASSNAMSGSKTAKPEGPGGNQQADSPVEFSSFVVSLATQAFAMLGEIQHPELRGVPVSMDGARQMIDVLSMLHEKTKGNLDSNEEKLITEALSSLRIAFVRRATGGAAGS